MSKVLCTLVLCLLLSRPTIPSAAAVGNGKPCREGGRQACRRLDLREIKAVAQPDSRPSPRTRRLAIVTPGA